MGANIGLIRHEAFHLLWDELVGQSRNSFFLEGIHTYYQFLKNDAEFAKAKGVQDRHPDYNVAEMISGGGNFWGGPGENNWPVAYDISGLVVKYLVDKWGLNTFKTFFARGGNAEAVQDTYGMSCEELARDYKAWFLAL